MKFGVLIIDDEELVCNSTRRILQDPELHIFTATSYSAAQEILNRESIDLVLLDYKLGTTNGLTVLEELKQNHPETAVVMVTAFGSIEVAVEAMKLGAYDFIQKKEKPDFIRFTVRRALDNLRLRKEVEELRLACQQELQAPEIIAASRAMKALLEQAREYAQSDSTVLITGETGTGKNLLSRYVHLQSPRLERPFVSINCAAIPRELMESELFGYERGAFTGARQKGKKGLVEQAAGGTLFLDEVGELDPDLQGKLLHVLENHEVLRVGALIPTRVDVRFVAASNADLRQLVDQKRFRMDLYYRLNVATLTIPPLRERPDDILPLTKFYVERFNRKFNKSVKKISEPVQKFLLNAAWEGNVRELENMIERAMLLKKNEVLELSDFAGPVGMGGNGAPGSAGAVFQLQLQPRPGVNLLQQGQQELVSRALELSGGNRSQAARLLGIPRTSLNFYLDKFGLKS